MLSRNVRIEQDLIDQLFNSSEQRLARALLVLARYGKQTKPRQVVAKISQETLSEMVGTTRQALARPPHQHVLNCCSASAWNGKCKSSQRAYESPLC